MKQYSLFFVLFLFTLNCSSWKKELVQKGNYEIATKNAIIDFYHTSSLVTKDNVFYVSHKEYKFGILGIGFLGDINKMYFVNGSLTQGRIPDQYIEYHNKLFYWYDDKKGKDPNIERELLKYNVIVNVDSLTEDMGYIRDEAKRGVHYYFCKDNFSIYKKETTSTAMPKEIRNDLNCKADIITSDIHTHPK